MAEKAAIGEVYWFDIPALRVTLSGLLMMEPADYEQWANGEHAAEFVSRVDRILASVEARQTSRQVAPQCTCHTPTRLGLCPIHEAAC